MNHLQIIAQNNQQFSKELLRKFHENARRIALKSEQGDNNCTVVKLDKDKIKFRDKNYSMKKKSILMRMTDKTQSYYTELEDPIPARAFIGKVDGTHQAYIMISTPEIKELVLPLDYFSLASFDKRENHEKGFIIAFDREEDEHSVSRLQGIPDLKAIKTMMKSHKRDMKKFDLKGETDSIIYLK